MDIPRIGEVDRSSMQLSTLVELLEREIGVSTSARAELARLVAERGDQQAVAPAPPRKSVAQRSKVKIVTGAGDPPSAR
jgi:hypothetical protein